MKLKTYVLNLERHAERLKAVGEQLDSQGIHWERFPAVDAREIKPSELDKLVAKTGPIPRMPNTARACTAGHIAILKDFLNADASHALILEDDVVLSRFMARDLGKIIGEFGPGVINISRQIPSGQTKRLVVKNQIERCGQYIAPELVGIHYSCAGYIVDKEAAKIILETNPYPNMPIDHIIFNPNVSLLGKKTKVRQLFPALVKPRENLVSSIQTEPVDGAHTLKNKLKRARSEVSILPKLLVGIAAKKYKVLQLDFAN